MRRGWGSVHDVVKKSVPEYLVWVEPISERVELTPPRVHVGKLVLVKIERLGPVRAAIVPHKQVLEKAEEMF